MLSPQLHGQENLWQQVVGLVRPHLAAMYDGGRNFRRRFGRTNSNGRPEEPRGGGAERDPQREAYAKFKVAILSK
eukprot:314896-Prorocentrum_minimum.AAC.1